MSSKDKDVGQWLSNKLSSSEDTWSSVTVAAQLNKERLSAIPSCFLDVNPVVKLKLLMGLVQIPKRNMELWMEDLKEILSLAMQVQFVSGFRCI